MTAKTAVAMEASACPPHSLIPPSSQTKKGSKLMKQAGSLVRQSHDPHSPIWIEGLTYPAQYLVRQTRSMTSQHKDSPSETLDRQKFLEDSLPAEEEKFHRDSLVVRIPLVYLHPEKDADLPSRKEASCTSHWETSLNARVISFPSMTDVVRQKGSNVLDFYLPDKLFQNLKLRKLQAANQKKQGNDSGKSRGCQLTRKARKSTIKLSKGAVGHNLPQEQDTMDRSQALALPHLFKVTHSQDSLPATGFCPPGSVCGGTTTKVCIRSTLFSRSMGDPLPISWLRLQDKTTPCALPSDRSFGHCEHGRNESSPVDSQCRRDDGRVLRISFLSGQGTSCASESNKIKEVGHVVWEVCITYCKRKQKMQSYGRKVCDTGRNRDLALDQT